jgi:ribosomal protein S21
LRYKKKFHKKRKPREKQMTGLSVPVYHNNVDMALKKLKRKIKDSNLFIDLKRKSYFEKPSRIKREKRNLAKARTRYQTLKEKENN